LVVERREQERFLIGRLQGGESRDCFLDHSVVERIEPGVIALLGGYQGLTFVIAGMDESPAEEKQ
jgi:hypothetical protein